MSEDYNFWCEKNGPWTHGTPDFPKKRRLGPQNGSGSSGTEKLLKIVRCTETKKIERNDARGPIGIGGGPPISTWITSYT